MEVWNGAAFAASGHGGESTSRMILKSYLAKVFTYTQWVKKEKGKMDQKIFEKIKAAYVYKASDLKSGDEFFKVGDTMGGNTFMVGPYATIKHGIEDLSGRVAGYITKNLVGAGEPQCTGKSFYNDYGLYADAELTSPKHLCNNHCTFRYTPELWGMLSMMQGKNSGWDELSKQLRATIPFYQIINKAARASVVKNIRTRSKITYDTVENYLNKMEVATNPKEIMLLKQKILLTQVLDLPLGNVHCYFCEVTSTNCEECAYAKAHGKCTGEGMASDFAIIGKMRENLQGAIEEFYASITNKYDGTDVHDLRRGRLEQCDSCGHMVIMRDDDNE
jgi:hypothetical protein